MMHNRTAFARVYLPAEPANDNIPGTNTLDDTRFFVALGAVCIGIFALAAYVAMSGSNDVVAMLRK